MTQLQHSPLGSFHEFIGRQLRRNPADMSPEQALQLWREQQSDREAIRDGLEQSDAGDVHSVSEVFSELRAELRGE